MFSAKRYKSREARNERIKSYAEAVPQPMNHIPGQFHLIFTLLMRTTLRGPCTLCVRREPIILLLVNTPLVKKEVGLNNNITNFHSISLIKCIVCNSRLKPGALSSAYEQQDLGVEYAAHARRLCLTVCPAPGELHGDVGIGSSKATAR